jgi:TetR/AcrR family transcriptional regulator, regulator of cefoperazone and chloramphenicol sensitivity
MRSLSSAASGRGRTVKTDRETRDRLLATAERLFSERGFKKVTVREICRAARANVAAVNYHFGDKLGLYREVLRSAIDVMRATSDAARAAGEGQPAEEQLRRYIAVFVRRLLDSGAHSWLHRLINREISDPTPALDALVEQGVRPRIEYLSHLVGEMIGSDPSDERVLRCVASIQAQSIAYLPNPIADRLGLTFTPTAAHIDEVARHIADFSIAGVHAIARACSSAAGPPPGGVSAPNQVRQRDIATKTRKRGSLKMLS